MHTQHKMNTTHSALWLQGLLKFNVRGAQERNMVLYVLFPFPGCVEGTRRGVLSFSSEYCTAHQRKENRANMTVEKQNTSCRERCYINLKYSHPQADQPKWKYESVHIQAFKPIELFLTLNATEELTDKAVLIEGLPELSPTLFFTPFFDIGGPGGWRWRRTPRL